MPTINLPAGSSTQLEPRPAHQQHLRSFAVHVYLGIAATLVIITIWCFKPRRRSSAPNSPTYVSQLDDKKIKVSLGRGRLVKPGLTEGFPPKVSSPESVLPRHSPLTDLSNPLSRAHSKARRASGYLQEMDHDDKGQISDGNDPKTTESRGVSNKPKSTSSSKHEAYLWPQSSQSASMTNRSSLDQLRRSTPSPKAFFGTDGRLSPTLGSGGKARGKGLLQAQQHQMYQTTGEFLSFDGSQRHDDGLHGVSYGERKMHFTTPPPPPPLTRPTLDRTASAFQYPRLTDAPSGPQDLDTSFIHQTNLEHVGHTSPVHIPTSSPSNATVIPRRRSYTKSVPVGIPTPGSSSSSSSATTVTSSAAFSPSSHRPSSPPFPSPPPVPHGYQFVGGHMGHHIADRGQHQDEIEVHGEIITVTDDNGDGWRRHTQVYGGGICLACNEGGFYGPNVPLEDRRY